MNWSTSNRNKLYDYILANRSQEWHWRKLQEECIELALAIQHYLINRADARNELHKEFGDVEIAMEMMSRVMQRSLIENSKSNKLDRIAARVPEWENK